MPQDVYQVDRLIVGLEQPPARETGPDADTLRLELWFKNPLGSPGATRRPPGMEVQDGDGRLFESRNSDWAEPILPDTEMTRQVVFEISPDSADLVLVLGPGQPDEVRIPISAG